MVAASKAAETTVITSKDTEIRVIRSFDAPQGLVFDCFTMAEHLPNWMIGPPGFTMAVCEVDLRVGGAYRCGWRNADGQAMDITGIFKEVRRPDRVVYTENWGGDWPETIQDYAFTVQDGKTLMTWTMIFPSKATRDAAIDTGATSGTDETFANLDRYLAKQGR
ncbi:MAG TPA: SRPBCC domain-containing protein [Gemmatimonadales bacterium]|jgi:uncharacterized protein YndB with AHSA1/START domain